MAAACLGYFLIVYWNPAAPMPAAPVPVHHVIPDPVAARGG